MAKSTKRFNQDVLVAARLAAHLTQTELSVAAEISVPTLSRIESGTRVPLEVEVERIAASLGMPFELFFEVLPAPSIGLPAFYHRRLKAAAVRDVQAVEGFCTLALVPLRRLLAQTSFSSKYQFPVISQDGCKGSGERAADMVRLLLQMPRGPVRNLVEVIEACGGFVIHFDFGIDAMDAMYQTAPGLPPIFWVNSRKSSDRIRFSLAHEFGHAVLHRQAMDVEIAEKQANEFARSFLMPRSDFRSHVRGRLSLVELQQLKQMWKTSMASVAYRAASINAIDQKHYKSLMVMFSRNGWRKAEPGQLPPEPPTIVSSLLRVLLDRLGGDINILSETLRFPVKVVKLWMENWPKPAQGENGPTLRLASDG